MSINFMKFLIMSNALAKAGKAVDFVSEHRPEIAIAFLGAGALLDAKLIYATAAGFLSSSPMLQAGFIQHEAEEKVGRNNERTLKITFEAYSIKKGS